MCSVLYHDSKGVVVKKESKTNFGIVALVITMVHFCYITFFVSILAYNMNRQHDDIQALAQAVEYLSKDFDGIVQDTVWCDFRIVEIENCWPNQVVTMEPCEPYVDWIDYDSTLFPVFKRIHFIVKDSFWEYKNDTIKRKVQVR